MYSLDTKLKDTLFAGEERYIRCGLFTFQIPEDNSDDNFRESLSWLEKNVRAETIDFSNDNKKINLEKISNFFFDASWKCAKREVKLGELYYVEIFSGCFSRGYQELDDDNSMKAPISGTDVIEERSDDSGGGIVYVISNGQNRMRVECSRKYPNDNGLRHVIACGPGGCRGYKLRQYNIRVEVYAV
ncbi:hypothetical protein Ddc_24120 [Ditylenchus destructor]|nr:hypothetical protein Ddc_24120 [Ditylenchus destructor]